MADRVPSRLEVALAIGGCCAVVGAPRTGSRGSFNVSKLLPDGRSAASLSATASRRRPSPSWWRPTGEACFPLEKIQRRYPFEEINDAADGLTIKPILVL